jgi:hypothetical protein
MDKEKYFTFKNDRSGSIAINRFGYQINVGICKVLELFNENIKFVVIFDNNSDIDILYDNEYEYIQCKSMESKAWTLNYLLEKKEGAPSILENLNKLWRHHEEQNIFYLTIAINSDSNIKEAKGEFEFNFKDLTDENKSKILNKISDLNVNKFRIQRYDMPINKQETYMIGKLSEFFTGNSIELSNTSNTEFYKYIYAEIERFTKNEAKFSDFDKLKECKGISSEKFGGIINGMKSISKKSVNLKLEKWIDLMTDINEKREYHRTFQSITTKYFEAKFIDRLTEIKAFLNDKNTYFKENGLSSESDILEYLEENFKFDSNYNKYEKDCILRLCIYSYSEGE